MVLYLVTMCMYLAVLLSTYLAVKSVWRFKIKFAYWPDKPLQIDVAGSVRKYNNCCDCVVIKLSFNVSLMTLILVILIISAMHEP